MPEEESEITEYRCSMCGEIGGDNETGAYMGCKKNNGWKHDTNGGVV